MGDRSARLMAVEEAQAALDKTLKGARPEEIEAAKARAATASSALEEFEGGCAQRRNRRSERAFGSSASRRRQSANRRGSRAQARRVGIHFASRGRQRRRDFQKGAPHNVDAHVQLIVFVNGGGYASRENVARTKTERLDASGIRRKDGELRDHHVDRIELLHRPRRLARP